VQKTLCVLVAFDGSEGAPRALHTALSIASGAEFRVVHAWWPPHVSLGDSDAARQVIGAENERLKALIERAAKEAVVSSPSQPGDAQGSTWPDLLVMGTHSKGRLATTVTIGNLARDMLAEVACDVLVSRS
jgi:nucleotide-binding universal stress UspA family protein